MDMDTKDLLIRMWATPNPYALKFVLNWPLKHKGRASFYRREECAHLPLFYSLFDLPGIRQVFVFQNQLTITHDGSHSEEDLEKQLTSIIRTRIALHDPDFLSEEEKPKDKKNLIDSKARKQVSPEVLKMESILDHHIRPGLRADGGDIEVLSVKEGEVRISYQGACGGCPSAMMGTLEAIENILRHETGQAELKVIPI